MLAENFEPHPLQSELTAVQEKKFDLQKRLAGPEDQVTIQGNEVAKKEKVFTAAKAKLERLRLRMKISNMTLIRSALQAKRPS